MVNHSKNMKEEKSIIFQCSRAIPFLKKAMELVTDKVSLHHQLVSPEVN